MNGLPAKTVYDGWTASSNIAQRDDAALAYAMFRAVVAEVLVERAVEQEGAVFEDVTLTPTFQAPHNEPVIHAALRRCAGTRGEETTVHAAWTVTVAWVLDTDEPDLRAAITEVLDYLAAI